MTIFLNIQKSYQSNINFYLEEVVLEFGPGDIGLELDPPKEEEVRPLLTNATPLNLSNDGRLYPGKMSGRITKKE